MADLTSGEGMMNMPCGNMDRQEQMPLPDYLPGCGSSCEPSGCTEASRPGKGTGAPGMSLAYPEGSRSHVRRGHDEYALR
jgi:hypothetical protein